MEGLFESGISLFQSLVQWLVAVIGHMGYPGIVGLMFLESSFFPFPSEVVVPPAGYLAYKGEMNLLLVVAAGIAGSILGALFNYWIAVKWGRPFFERYGKYFLVSPESLDKAEAFFAKHGTISTFTGRLLPVIRQYISLPAGLARMPLKPFCFYTALGSGIWVVILALVGYYIGDNQALIHQEIRKITYVLLASCAVLVALYIWRYNRKKKSS
ncbi:MAG TPA: DedA family protein [Synergistaceae bacterium]|nr:DedA family protein [Synergistaceae bacterium]